MKLIGPFSQLITFRDTPSRGSLTNEKLDIILNAGILFENKKIVHIDSFLELAKKHKNAEVIELEGEFVGLPGMIDCHTHLLWGGSRAGDFEKRNSGVSYQQILKEGGGIMDTVAKTRAASDEELVSGLKNRVNRHLKDGITTIEVKTGYGLNFEQELRFLRLINTVNELVDSDLIPTFLGAHVCPKEFDKKAYLDLLLNEAIPQIVDNSLSKRVDIFVEPEAFDEEVSEYYLDKISPYGFAITVHGGQFTPEGAVLALKYNALSVDHLERITEKEIALFKNSNTVPVALPGASLGLGEPFTPARKLLDVGASLAIATDWNPGSAPQGDLVCQASILSTHQKLSTAEVLAGITFRSALALGLQDRGRLKEGYCADFILFEINDYREILYQMGRLKPKFVYKNGEIKN